MLPGADHRIQLLLPLLLTILRFYPVLGIAILSLNSNITLFRKYFKNELHQKMVVLKDFR